MKDKIRVLIVDDSAFARFAISKQLGDDDRIEVIDTARNGIDAIEKIKVLKPDVVTLDVEMPQMDGLTALKHIMADYPTPVIMLSSITQEGAETTFKALNLGATDFFLKPSQTAPAGLNGNGSEDLVAKIKVAAGIDVMRMRQPVIKHNTRIIPKQFEGKPRKRHSNQHNKIVVIGSSTGGPRALHEVIPKLPGDIPASILVVQHMPPGFTKSLAERLDSISEIDVKEAEQGDMISPGLALIAPGGSHMTVSANGRISLNQGPQECGLRPAVNITMEAAAKAYGKSVVGVVLTGMGTDGTRGATLIKKAGGEVIIEDESTCVVYGMPMSVFQSGNADKALPLPQIAHEINRRCNQKNFSRDNK